MGRTERKPCELQADNTKQDVAITSFFIFLILPVLHKKAHWEMGF